MDGGMRLSRLRPNPREILSPIGPQLLACHQTTGEVLNGWAMVECNLFAPPQPIRNGGWLDLQMRRQRGLPAVLS